MKKNLNEKQTVTLVNVLDQIPDNSLIWCILDIDISNDFQEDEYFAKVVDDIKTSHGKKKYFLHWDEINKMSKKFCDIVNFLVVGCKNKEIIFKIENELYELGKKDYPTTDRLTKIYEYLIDIEDGLLRAIYAQDQTFENKCLKEFGPYPVPIY